MQRGKKALLCSSDLSLFYPHTCFYHATTSWLRVRLQIHRWKLILWILCRLTFWGHLLLKFSSSRGSACMCVLCYWQEVERFWHHWRNVHKLLLFFLLYMIFSVWAHSVPPPPPPPPYAHLLLSSVFELCLVLIQELHIWTPSSNDPQWGSQCLRQHSEGSLVCYFWLWFINPLA